MSDAQDFDLGWDKRPFGLAPDLNVYEYAVRSPYRRGGDWSLHKTRESADRSFAYHQRRTAHSPFEMWQRRGSDWVQINLEPEGQHEKSDE